MEDTDRRHKDWLRRMEPVLQVQRELKTIQEMLRSHVALALEFGTEPDAILAHLRNVRRAVLVVQRKAVEHG